MIRFKCPQCGKAVKVGNEAAGKKGKCPGCRETIHVPQTALVSVPTATIRALADGQLDELEKMGMDEVGVAVEWSTAGDDCVCPLCQPLHGIVLTTQEARGMIPRHESCRCCWTPANVGEDKRKQKRSQKRIQQAIDKSIMAEIPEDNNRSLADQKERSLWAGANKTVAKKRPKSIFG